jgi:DNA modification methylase
MRINKNSIKINPAIERYYGEFSLKNRDDYELWKSISLLGIQQKIVVSKNLLVISGNRRLKVALLLANIQEIEVDVRDIEDEEVDELLIITNQLTRVKDEVTIAWEYDRLTTLYGLKQGVKNKHEEIESRKNIVSESGYSQKTVDRTLDAKRYYMEIHECPEEEAWNYLREERREKKKEINHIRQSLLNQLNAKRNEIVIKEHKIYNDDWFNIYHRDNRNLKDIIQDNEIDCVMTSPPYYQLRYYVEDEVTNVEQQGQEQTVEEYIENLLDSLRECIRTMKDSGSLWVNIMDVRRDGEILGIPDELRRAIKKEGLKCVQICIWYKNNPAFSSTNTFQPTMEYILHFVKDIEKYKWFNDWFGKEDTFINDIDYGAVDKARRFKNVFIYPEPQKDGVGVADGLIKTNVNNPSFLVKLMKEKGITLSHHAMYPLEIPMVCILSTSESGDSILDPYHGLGTTGLISYAHGCKYFGIEKSREYAVQSSIRIEDFLENNPHILK